MLSFERIRLKREINNIALLLSTDSVDVFNYERQGFLHALSSVTATIVVVALPGWALRGLVDARATRDVAARG